jgi:hypothetical protein
MPNLPRIRHDTGGDGPAMRNTCASCGAPIIFARTGSGKAIPIDAEPNPAGNIELADGTAKSWGTSHQWPPGADRYTTHFATCPHAAEHRRARTTKTA